jgi:hypothetical protein
VVRADLMCGVVGWVAFVLAGCSSSSSATEGSDAEFKSLVTLYSYAVKYGRPPKDEAEFKTDIKSGRLAPVANALKVTDVDALFVSKRDGKPVVVVYGQRPAGMHPDVVAYEQNGVNGKRLIGFALGMTEEADEVRFRELVPAGVPSK